MSEMVELVAEAMCNVNSSLGWHEILPRDQEVYRNVARVAIKAMMEPTEAMLKAPVVGYMDERAAIYQAMLTAALED